LNRTGAACGLPTILRAVQNFVSHYLPTTRHATQLCQETALNLLTAFTPAILSPESIRQSIRTV
jgi:hypothetical protein